MSAIARQRIALTHLDEPQQMRELNRQLEWIWSQLMGGLTGKSLSGALRQTIDGKTDDSAFQSYVSQTASALDARVTNAQLDARLSLVPGQIEAAVHDARAGGINLLKKTASLDAGDGAGQWRLTGGASVLPPEDDRPAAASLSGEAALASPVFDLEDGWTGKSFALSAFVRSDDWSGLTLRGTLAFSDGGRTRRHYFSKTVVWPDDPPEEGVWKRVSVVFDPQTDSLLSDTGAPLTREALSANAHAYAAFSLSGAGEIGLYAPKLEYGPSATDWTTAPDEFCAGSRLILTGERVFIGTPEFAVEIQDSGESLMLDKTGGVMGSLTVTQTLSAPNMVCRHPGGTLVVGGSGEIGTLSEAARQLDDSLLTGDVTIRLDADIYDAAELRGLHGSGTLTIDGDGHTLYGSLALRGIASPVTLKSITVVEPDTSEKNYALLADSVARLSLTDDVTLKGRGLTEDSYPVGSRALRLTGGSAVLLENVQLYDAEALLDAGPLCRLCIRDLSGGGCDQAALLDGCSVVWNGTRPGGALSLVSPCLTAPADLTTLDIETGSAPQAAPEVSVFSLTAADSAYCYSIASWAGGREMIQGMYDSTKHRGVMWFDTTALAGRTVIQASLTLTRNATSGSAGSVRIRLWGTPCAGRSGNPNTGAVDYGVIGSIRPGETLEMRLDPLVAARLADGTHAALMINPGDTTLKSGKRYSDNYARFDGSTALLTVTAQSNA